MQKIIVFLHLYGEIILLVNVSLYLSAGSPELPLEKLQFHLDSYSWVQKNTK